MKDNYTLLLTLRVVLNNIIRFFIFNISVASVQYA